MISVLTIPNLSPYISAQFIKIPSVNKIEKEVRRLRGVERDKLGRKMSAELGARYKEEYGTLYADYSKIQKTLGWTPSVSLNEGLRRSVAYYMEHRDHYWGGS